MDLWLNINKVDKSKIQQRRPFLCYCPEWSEIGYQVAYWNGKEFYYDEQPNDQFNSYVEKFCIFYEAD